jgi:hypothetical protein
MSRKKHETPINQPAESLDFPPSYIDYAAVLAMNGVIEIVQNEKVD